MQFPSIAPRLRRRLAMGLPVVASALAFAPAASAATTQPVIYTPADTPTLQADIASADAAAPGTLSVIELCGCVYQPTASLPLDGNIEITGPPTLQAVQNVTQDPQINGGVVFNLSPAVPLFTVGAGANILFKGFDLADGGNGSGVGSIEQSGGTLLLDDMDVTGSLGSALVMQAGSATIVNSNISGGTLDGIEQNGTGVANLVNDTLAYNTTGALSGPNLTVDNSYFYKNGSSGTCSIGTTGDTFAGDYSTDSTCGTTGVTVNTTLTRYTGLQAFNGGPSLTVQLKTGNPAIGKGLAQYCPATADERFFTYTQGPGGTCDVGSYQTTGVQDTSTTGPVCTVGSVSESSDPAVPSTETVNVTDPGGIGIGPDAVDYTITNNGSVGYPVTGTSWFNETDPSFSLDPSYETVGPYAVTATKPAGDLTVGDTKWSFYATDWLGNTTYCN